MNSRQKGNRFERDTMRRLVEVDGACPQFGGLATSTGRVGHLDLGADGFTKTFAVECKNRGSIGSYLWGWLDHLADRVAWTHHIPILVIKRNGRRPLVVIDQDYFEALVKERNVRD